MGKNKEANKLDLKLLSETLHKNIEISKGTEDIFLESSSAEF